MNSIKKHSLPVLLVVLHLIFAAQVMAEIAGYDLLPPGITISDVYKQGYGNPVGRVQDFKGTVIVHHKSAKEGYKAFRDMPIYQNDTIVTTEDGRVVLRFNDKSTLSLTSMTKLVINRSVYNPKKKERSSFLSMLRGKARFLVRKMKGFRRSEYKVKTKTLVAGIRGSDFIIEAFDKRTEVIALEDTVIEVYSLAFPDKIVTMKPYERLAVDEGAEPSEITKITPEEAEQQKFELPIPDGSGADYDLQEGIIEGAGSESVLFSGEKLVNPDDVGLSSGPGFPLDFPVELPESIDGPDDHQPAESQAPLPEMPGPPQI